MITNIYLQILWKKQTKKRKDYYLDDDRYSYYGRFGDDCDDWLDDCLEYEENVLYLMAYTDNDVYISITPYGKEGYEIYCHNYLNFNNLNN